MREDMNADAETNYVACTGSDAVVGKYWSGWAYLY